MLGVNERRMEQLVNAEQPNTYRPLPAARSLGICLAADGISIDQDLLCSKCDYNLRMQTRDGVCPECGTAIETTIAKRTLMLLNPHWLKGITLGARILSYGIPIVMFAAIGINLVVNMFIPNSDVWFLLGGLAVLGLVGVVGIWCYARPLQTDLASNRLQMTSLVARIASLIFLILIVFVFNIPPHMDDAIIAFLAFTIMFFFIAAAVSFALYCGEIARMLDEEKARKRCIAYVSLFGLGWLLTVPGIRAAFAVGTRPTDLVLGMLLGGSGVIVIFGMLILVLPNHLTKQLRQVRDEARGMLHSESTAPVQSGGAAV